jgi:predicted acylesterase/phospholipase RssA
VGRRALALMAVVAVSLIGCRGFGSRGNSCPSPTPITGLVDRECPANTVPVLDTQTVVPPAVATAEPLGHRPFNILVLSAGGAYGAYPAGVLAGWSEAGTRPQFDVVTGVSTGALVATLAFLGPERDAELKRFYTQVTDRDVFARRPQLSILLTDALADSRPLERQIEQAVDADLLRQIAAEHARGRRLYVGTTHLDARRLVVWDMGEIASRGRPDDLTLFRKILLASASLPGLLPPVAIPVEVEGKKYEEMHVDGGVTASLFFRPPHVPPTERARLGDKPLAGSNVYVIVAGKLFADPEAVQPRFLSIVGSSVSALLHAQTRGDLYEVYALAVATGMNYQLAAVPAGARMPSSSTSFDPAAMNRLYEAGRRQAASPDLWRNTPPGTQPGEQVPVRGGVHLSPLP